MVSRTRKSSYDARFWNVLAHRRKKHVPVVDLTKHPTAMLRLFHAKAMLEDPPKVGGLRGWSIFVVEKAGHGLCLSAAIPLLALGAFAGSSGALLGYGIEKLFRMRSTAVRDTLIRPGAAVAHLGLICVYGAVVLSDACDRRRVRICLRHPKAWF